MQFPLLELCRDEGGFELKVMSKLYVEELKIAGAAARGEHEWTNGEGAPTGAKEEAMKPVTAK